MVDGHGHRNAITMRAADFRKDLQKGLLLEKRHLRFGCFKHDPDQP